MVKWQRIQLAVAQLVLSAGIVRAQPPAALESTLAVPNFVNRGQADPAWDWLAKGLADLTIGDIAGQQFKVVDRERTQAILQNSQSTNAGRDSKVVAQPLKATRYVDGSYLVEDGHITLRAALHEVQPGTQLRAAEVQGPAESVLGLQKQIARQLLEMLEGQRLDGTEAQFLTQWTNSLPAARLLYEGIDRFDQGDYLDAWSHFRRALSADPNYADARFWSGRAMYQLQEYRQAYVDLVRFGLDYPSHPRIGDAAAHIIYAAQQVAKNADEVLQAVDLAIRLSPQAEVPNQFGPGYDSNVGILGASVAGPLLRARGQLREAYLRYAGAIEDLPLESRQYWFVWHDMIGIAIDHLRASGELLPVPERPIQPAQLSNGQSLLSPGGLHPSGTRTFGEFVRGGDEMVGRDFVHVSPSAPTAVIDFGSDPLLQQQTFTRYVHSEPTQLLTELDLEVFYRPDPRYPTSLRIEGDCVTPFVQLPPEGTSVTLSLKLAAPAYCAALRLNRRGSIDAIKSLRAGATSAAGAITSWKVTGKFQEVDAPAGTIVFHNEGNLPIKVKFDEIDLPPLESELRLEHITAGKHLLDTRLDCWGATVLQRRWILLDDGATVDFKYSFHVDPQRLYTATLGSWDKRRISSAYNPIRLGTHLAAKPKLGDVRVLDDGDQRLIAVWSMRRDLYLARSSDNGQNWSDTVRLPNPVNSASEERMPVLLRAADGRYVLAFVSDRNPGQVPGTYACYSDDLTSFSAPVLVTGQASEPVSLIQRPDGQFLCYALLPDGDRAIAMEPKAGDRWCVMTSDNLLHWSQPTECVPTQTIPNWSPPVRPAAVAAFWQEGDAIWYLARYGADTMYAARSADGINFEKPDLIPFQFRMQSTNGVVDAKMSVNQISFKRVQGQTKALLHGGQAQLVFLDYDSDALQWKASGMLYHNTQLPSEVVPADFILRERGVELLSLAEGRTINESLHSMVLGTWMPSAWFAGAEPLMTNFVPYDEFEITRERIREPGSEQIDAVPQVTIRPEGAATISARDPQPAAKRSTKAARPPRTSRPRLPKPQPGERAPQAPPANPESN